MKFRIAKVRDGGRMDGLDDPRDELTGKWRVNCIDCRRILGYYDEYDRARESVIDQFTSNYPIDGWTIADCHKLSTCWLSWCSAARRRREVAGHRTVVRTPAQKLAGDEAATVSKSGGLGEAFGLGWSALTGMLHLDGMKSVVPQQDPFFGP